MARETEDKPTSNNTADVSAPAQGTITPSFQQSALTEVLRDAGKQLNQLPENARGDASNLAQQAWGLMDKRSPLSEGKIEDRFKDPFQKTDKQLEDIAKNLFDKDGKISDEGKQQLRNMINLSQMSKKPFSVDSINEKLAEQHSPYRLEIGKPQENTRAGFVMTTDHISAVKVDENGKPTGNKTDEFTYPHMSKQKAVEGKLTPDQNPSQTQLPEHYPLPNLQIIDKK